MITKKISDFWKKTKKTVSPKIYMIGNDGCEHSYTMYVCFTYKTALFYWNDVRKDLLTHAREMNRWSIKEAKKHYAKETNEDSKKYYKKIIDNGDDMYNRMIKNLKCKDPRKMDNYPQDSPFLSTIDITFRKRKT